MTFSLPHQSRTLAAQLAEQERPRFFVATANVLNSGADGSDNELRLLDFDEDENEISTQLFPHKNQISYIAPSPDKSDFVFVCHQDHTQNPNPRATLYLLSALQTNDAQPQKLANQTGSLTELLTIDSRQLQNVRQVMWDPNGTRDRVVVSGDTEVGVFGIDGGVSKATLTSKISILPLYEPTTTLTTTAPAHPLPKIHNTKWNPHNTDEIAVASTTHIHGFDLRAPTSPATFSIPHAHADATRTIDYNPNKPYTLVSAGNDGAIRVWDTRGVVKPVAEARTAHTHWVWQVEVNRYHDQLVIGCGSDKSVGLWAFASVCSMPGGLGRYLDEDEGVGGRRSELLESGRKSLTDELIATYREFDDSVYAVAWSSADPWIFAAVSFDGRININIVPRDVKYSIILD